MADFILVHGAYSGSHMWGKVRPLLRAAGHEVYTPCLTGIGERSHLVGPEVGFTTHVRDVVQTIVYEDLSNVTLLGYSYGGRVVTGTLDYISDRVDHLVYLDSSVPDDGDLGANSFAPLSAANVIEYSANWLISRPVTVTDSVDDPDDNAWISSRRVPMPIGCFVEPVRLSRKLEDFDFTRTYIKATATPRPPDGGPAWTAADRARSSSLWQYREIQTNHLIPRNRPQELVDILLELVGANS